LLKKSVLPIVFSLSILILLIPAPNSYAGVGSTTVFSTGFESGLPAEFGGGGVLQGTQGFSAHGFDDNFLRNLSTGNPAFPPTGLNLSGLQCHTSVDVLFSFAQIDSWDGTATSVAPDFFNVVVDQNGVYLETFDTFDESDQTGPTDPPAQLSWGTNLGFSGSFADAAYDLSNESGLLNIPHSSVSIDIQWFASGAGWQGGTDESWAIDNVEIILNGLDDPACISDGPVGGEFLPIDSTALLLAAASSPASWLATLTIAALGIGVYVFTRNPNNMRNIKVILRDYLDRF